MPSSRDRQRKLARAKLDRQMARRAAGLRRRRQRQAAVGAGLAVVLITLGSVWFLGGFKDDPKPPAAAEPCVWSPQSAANNDKLRDVGTPPTKDLATAGTRPMTIATSQGGPITATLDLAAAPCAGASFAHLAERKFFDNTKCHEITADGALRCGDPSGTGTGGPTYSFYSENVPSPEPSSSTAPTTPAAPTYPKGTVALLGVPAGNNGSQFLIFLKDFTPAEAPAYPIVGTVTGGLDVLDKIAKVPTVDNGAGAKVKPQPDIVVQSLTVGGPTGGPGTNNPPVAPSAST